MRRDVDTPTLVWRECRCRSVLGQPVRGDVLRRALLQVEAQFFVNLPLHRRPLPQRAEPLPECFHVVKFSSFQVFRFSSFHVVATHYSHSSRSRWPTAARRRATELSAEASFFRLFRQYQAAYRISLLASSGPISVSARQV